MRHKSKREKGNVVGNYRRSGQGGIVVSENGNSGAEFGSLPGLVVYLKEATMAQRKEFRRWCIGKGLRERVVQWHYAPDGKRSPAALEVTGLPQSLNAVFRLELEAQPIISGIHAIMDTPTFGRAAGSGELSDSAKRFRMLNKQQQSAQIAKTHGHMSGA